VHFGIFLIVATLLASMVHSSALEEVFDQSSMVAVVSSHKNVDHAGLVSKIFQLAQRYDSASPQDEAVIGAELSKVVLQRRDLLKKELRSNPNTFLTHALPASVVKKMPDLVQSLLEQPVEIQGEITVVASEKPSLSQIRVDETLYDVTVQAQTGIKNYRLYFTGKEPDVVTGARVAVRGTRLDDDIVVSSSADAPTGSGTNSSGLTVVSAPTYTSPGPQKAIVMLINFTNNTSQPWDSSYISAEMFTNPDSVNLYYQDTTYGKVSVSGDVVGWFTVPYASTGCETNYYNWMVEADKVATASGVNFANYTRKIYITNGSDDCSFGGRGTIGGTPGWSLISQNLPGTIAHEIGHNLALHHAQLLDCKSSQIASSYAGCTIGVAPYGDYGDPSDVMGAWNYFGFNGPHRVALASLDTIQQQTVTASGVYVIETLESTNSTAVKSLKINKPDTGEAYYISYRQPVGFDAGLSSGLTNGASVIVWGGSPSVQTKLVDMTPGDGSMANAALTDGATFTDPMNGIAVTQLSHTPTAVTVDVKFPQPVCYKSAPSVYLSPVSQDGSDGKTLSYQVTVSNRDSSACAPATFSLSGQLPSGWTGSFSQPSITVAVGASVTAVFQVTPSAGIPDGAYPLSVYASDVADTTHVASVSGSYVSFTDVSPPVVTITSPLNGAKIKGAKPVTISVNAKDQNTIASIVISVAGKVLKTCTGVSSCSTNWAVNKLPVGQYVISASATDTSGTPKTGTASITVTR
jgi:hypothetical protein